MPVFNLHLYDKNNRKKPSISDKICIDPAFGHRPLLFFLAAIISHSPKPYSHTPRQYANNVPGLPLRTALERYE